MYLLSEDQRVIQDTCRQLLAKHSTSSRIRAVIASATGHDSELWAATAELGWPALAVPEAEGGLGGGVRDLVVVAEEFGRAIQPSLMVQTLAGGWTLGRHGAPSAVLQGIASGEIRLTVAPCQPGAPSGLASPRGASTLSGTQPFVPDLPSATHVLVETSDGEIVLVDRGRVGVSASDTATLDLTRRYGRLHCDLVPLEADERIDGGPAAAGDLFNVAVVLQCAESTGVAGRLLDMTVAYASDRHQFDRPIGSFQAIKHRIADMLIEVEGCRVATRQAAEALDAGEDVAQAVSVAKSWVGRAASFVATHALQIHGGIGFTWDHDLHLLLRRAKTNELLLGAPAWHEAQLSARLVALG